MHEQKQFHWKLNLQRKTMYRKAAKKQNHQLQISKRSGSLGLDMANANAIQIKSNRKIK